MSSTENIIPDWVWKRRYSVRYNKASQIILGLFFGILGLIIVLAAFYVRSNIEDVCASYIGCSGAYSPGSPLGNALSLMENLTAVAVAISAGGLGYALAAWMGKPSEWAAGFGLQAFARHLQQMYSEGKLTRQQAEELLANMTASLRR